MRDQNGPLLGLPFYYMAFFPGGLFIQLKRSLLRAVLRKITIFYLRIAVFLLQQQYSIATS